ncbi:MAG: GNAT family N-acetyltransferase [Anaerolineales bacterium]|nr:GNAT family N-acetyltransferase [Anaerolineales bacterium]
MDGNCGHNACGILFTAGGGGGPGAAAGGGGGGGGRGGGASLPRNDGDSLWLDNLWVLPGFMGQGIGKQLFQHALERSRALGESVLKIEADPNAQSFYEKMGVRKVGESHSQVDGQPRILPIMEINL